MNNKEIVNEFRRGHNPLLTNITKDEVYVSYKADELIIFFDGSEGIKEWANNLKISDTEFGYHKGFYDTAKEFQSIFLDELFPIEQKNIKIICYSRGVYGLIWVLTYRCLYNKNVNIYLYGCPGISKKHVYVPANIHIEKTEIRGDRIPGSLDAFGYNRAPADVTHILGSKWNWFNLYKVFTYKYHREYFK